MEIDSKTYNSLFIMTLVAAVVYTIAILSNGQKNSIYYVGFLFLPVFLYVAYRFNLKKVDMKALEFVRNSFGKKIVEKRNFKKIRKFFDYSVEGSDKFYVDDQTWNDLDMDEVFKELDRCLTTPGQGVFYSILRKPLRDKEKIELREKLIEHFGENKELLDKLEVIFYKFGKENSTSTISSLLFKDIKVNDSLKAVYDVLFYMVCASIALLLVPILGYSHILGYGTVGTMIVILFFVNMYIHYSGNKTAKDGVNSIAYMGTFARAALSVNDIKDDAIKPYVEKIEKAKKALNIIKGSTPVLGRIQGVDLFSDYIYILFLKEERSYYKTISTIKKYRKELVDAYEAFGTIEAMISVYSYRKDIKEYAKPEFTQDEVKLELTDVNHPLLEKSVPNSISINSSGIIITGSNMAGKSTFLRTVGVNALMAQTINTCLAKKYVGSFFKILTSISPSDNILKGKSYYMGEASALLRIVKESEKNEPMLCMIDEIFRGTNPLERISAASEILKYLSDHHALTIVATHDKELTELTDNKYECYYFSEDVNEDGLSFDYKIKRGTTPTRNAIKLLKYLGYPDTIVQNADKRVIAEQQN